mgnify:CR=1 FL=1
MELGSSYYFYSGGDSYRLLFNKVRQDDLEEDNTYEFQDKVLSCLFKLELSATKDYDILPEDYEDDYMVWFW